MSASKSASDDPGHCKTRMYRMRTYQSIWGWPKAFRHLLLDVEGLPLFGSDRQRFVKGPLKRQHVFLSGPRRKFLGGLSGGCQCDRLMVVFVLLGSLFLFVPFDPGQ